MHLLLAPAIPSLGIGPEVGNKTRARSFVAALSLTAKYWQQPADSSKDWRGALVGPHRGVPRSQGNEDEDGALERIGVISGVTSETHDGEGRTSVGAGGAAACHHAHSVCPRRETGGNQEKRAKRIISRVGVEGKTFLSPPFCPVLTCKAR